MKKGNYYSGLIRGSAVAYGLFVTIGLLVAGNILSDRWRGSPDAPPLTDVFIIGALIAAGTLLFFGVARFIAFVRKWDT